MTLRQAYNRVSSVREHASYPSMDSYPSHLNREQLFSIMRMIVLNPFLVSMQQVDILFYLGKLQDYYAREKIIPSITQLSGLWNVKARSWTHGIVQRLKEEGFLEKAPGSRLRPTPRFFERSVGHPVRAGLPQQAADVQPELLRIDDYLIEKPSQTILFPVKGDSMVDLGILEGDMVIIERSTTAAIGQVVLAIVDNEFTLKVLARDRKGYYLEARNGKRSGDYPPIRPAQKLEIYGLYAGLFRKNRIPGHHSGSGR